MHHLKKLLPRKGSKEKKKRDRAQTAPLTSVGLANPLAPTNQPAAPLSPTDRRSTVPLIGRDRRGGDEHEPSNLNPSTSTTISPHQSHQSEPIPIHGPPSVPHVKSAVQDGNESDLDLAAPTVAPYNNPLFQGVSNRQPLPVAQTSNAVPDATSLCSNLGISIASSPQPSPTATTIPLEGATGCVLHWMLHSLTY